MSKVIIIDALTESQINEVSVLVKRFEDENNRPVEKIDYKNGCVIVNGYVKQAKEVPSVVVAKLYGLGLYKNTREECEKLLKKMQIEHRLREWSKLCKDKIDWNSICQDKYFITKGYGEIYIDNVKVYQSNEIYFTDRSILQKAIKDIGEKVLCDDYLAEV